MGYRLWLFAAPSGASDGCLVKDQNRSPQITHVSWGRLEVEGKAEPYKDEALSRRLKGVELARDRHRARAGHSADRRAGVAGPRRQGCGAFARDGGMPAGPSRNP